MRRLENSPSTSAEREGGREGGGEGGREGGREGVPPPCLGSFSWRLFWPPRRGWEEGGAACSGLPTGSIAPAQGGREGGREGEREGRSDM